MPYKIIMIKMLYKIMPNNNTSAKLNCRCLNLHMVDHMVKLWRDCTSVCLSIWCHSCTNKIAWIKVGFRHFWSDLFSIGQICVGNVCNVFTITIKQCSLHDTFIVCCTISYS